MSYNIFKAGMPWNTFDPSIAAETAPRNWNAMFSVSGPDGEKHSVSVRLMHCGSGEAEFQGVKIAETFARKEFFKDNPDIPLETEFLCKTEIVTGRYATK